MKKFFAVLILFTLTSIPSLVTASKSEVDALPTPNEVLISQDDVFKLFKEHCDIDLYQRWRDIVDDCMTYSADEPLVLNRNPKNPLSLSRIICQLTLAITKKLSEEENGYCETIRIIGNKAIAFKGEALTQQQLKSCNLHELFTKLGFGIAVENYQQNKQTLQQLETTNPNCSLGEIYLGTTPLQNLVWDILLQFLGDLCRKNFVEPHDLPQHFLKFSFEKPSEHQQPTLTQTRYSGHPGWASRNRQWVSKLNKNLPASRFNRVKYLLWTTILFATSYALYYRINSGTEIESSHDTSDLQDPLTLLHKAIGYNQNDMMCLEEL